MKQKVENEFEMCVWVEEEWCEIVPGNAIMPTVQNISIQHSIFSLYLVGWNSPKYGKQMPIAPATLFLVWKMKN